MPTVQAPIRPQGLDQLVNRRQTAARVVRSMTLQAPVRLGDLVQASIHSVSPRVLVRLRAVPVIHLRLVPANSSSACASPQRRVRPVARPPSDRPDSFPERRRDPNASPPLVRERPSLFIAGHRVLPPAPGYLDVQGRGAPASAAEPPEGPPLPPPGVLESVPDHRELALRVTQLRENPAVRRG